MKRITVLVTLVILIAVIFGCASDIILEEEKSLKGVYKGRYIVTELGVNPVRWVQNIDFVFKDIAFYMDVDEKNYNSDFCVCNVSGQYTVKEKVQMKTINSVPPGYPLPGGNSWCTACASDYNPDGDFALERPPDTDSLKLTYVDTLNDLLKEILLVRVSE